jgi:regulator of protease activity HflC (stomatin/prohibitin superfamily)
MAKRIDYEKVSKPGVKKSDVYPTQIPAASVKAETKANQDRLARIEKMQEAEEAARKQKIAAAKEERAARMKAEVEAAKAKTAAKGGGSPSMLSPRRAMGISPTKKRLMLAGGGKACRGRKANYKV